MGKLVSLVGLTIGHLYVKTRPGSTPRRQARYLCECRRCGREFTVLGYSLSIDLMRACGRCEDMKIRATVMIIDGRGTQHHF